MQYVQVFVNTTVINIDHIDTQRQHIANIVEKLFKALFARILIVVIFQRRIIDNFLRRIGKGRLPIL